MKWVRLPYWPQCPFVDLEDMHPQVKRLTWPDSVSPSDLPDFETQARRLRYQALGIACRQNLLQWLLLAHHDDDQAETVLMRLASGHRGLGLQGMTRKGPIPECWGIHGVSRSGLKEAVALRRRVVEQKGRRTSQAWLSKPGPDIFEQGGISILRPLLDFSKARLIETCRTRALDWEEDETNQDTWRTPRNSIRALLCSAKLPQVLLKDSMLQLAKQSSDILRMRMATTMRILACCEILLFDARCGGLVIRLPLSLTSRLGSGGGQYTGHVRLTALLLLRTVVVNVAPQEDISLPSLEQAMMSIFPELQDRDTLANRALQSTSFTAGGVQFQRLYSPVAASRSELDPSISGQSKDLDPVFVWKLTRQPFSKAPLSLMVQPSDNTLSWSSWQLWDGRYWIRLLNRCSQPLIVRSFQPSDLEHLRSTLSRQRYKEFHQFLHLTVPGKVRWTLLAVAEIEDDSLPMGRLHALPTLGQAGTFDTSDTNKVEWQIRYKGVTLRHEISDDHKSKIYGKSSIITSWHD